MVNNLSTYRRRTMWTSHSKDVMENFKRFVNNNFNGQHRETAGLIGVSC